MTIAQQATTYDQARLAKVSAQQERVFMERQTGSAALLERGRSCMAGGGTSSWQISRPQMIWLSHGSGSKVYDVEGMEYVDLHGGYGVALVGHGHPRIVDALSTVVPRGTHFAQPTQAAIEVAEELARRFGLPLWRFGNSGTEATMDAFHLMRVATGRDLVIKIEGCYHGHHDSAMVSVNNAADEIGAADRPASPASGSGIPRAITELTLIAPFNDLEAIERRFQEHPGKIAGMILEPIMMNSGTIQPEAGYLEQLKEIVHRHDALLTFDEVKTGLTVGPGGATGLYAVTPDIITLAKALGGGVPCGAVGGTAEVMQIIADGRYEQVGTFNGNPLTMAAARSVLCEILDDEAYRHLEELRQHIVGGTEEIILQYGVPAYVVAIGARGSVTFSRDPVRNYRDYLQIDDDLSQLHWLVQHNGGVFLPPAGKSENWTLSVQHSIDDVQKFVDNFEAFAQAVWG